MLDNRNINVIHMRVEVQTTLPIEREFAGGDEDRPQDTRAMSAKPNVLLIDWELGEIQSALQASALILDHLANHQLATEEEERIAPRLAASVTNLAVVRLKDVCRALRNEADPRYLLTEFNSLPDGRDIARDHLGVLRPWKKDETALPVSRRPRRRRGGKTTRQTRGAKP